MDHGGRTSSSDRRNHIDDCPGLFLRTEQAIVWRERCHKAQNGCISPHMAMHSSPSWYPARGAVFTNASAARHRLVTRRSYSQRMNHLQSDLVPELQIAPMYRVVLTLHGERTIVRVERELTEPDPDHPGQRRRAHPAMTDLEFFGAEIPPGGQ